MADETFSGEVIAKSQIAALCDVTLLRFVTAASRIESGSLAGIVLVSSVTACSQIEFVTEQTFSGEVAAGSQIAVVCDQTLVSFVQSESRIAGYAWPTYRTVPSVCTEQLVLNGDCVFVGPAETLQYSIRIKAPKIGNTDRLELGLVLKHSRNGTRWAFKRSARTILLLSWDSIPRGIALQLEAFFIATTANDIYYYDHEGNRWRGLVRNPEIDFTNQARDGSMGFSVEFEGDKL